MLEESICMAMPMWVFQEGLTLMKIYESEGEGDGIAVLIQEATIINPNDRRIQVYRDRLFPQVNINIGELLEEAGFYAQQGMIDEAVTVYEKILKVNPQNH